MDDRLKIYDEKMTKSYNAMLEDFSAIRAGRANPHVLDHIRVDYYGAPTPLQQVANVNVPEARIIQITPWDKKMVNVIVKAIQTSDLGINPNTDGMTIRLVFPELTEERRKELSKEVRKKGEAAKVAVRNIRRDANDAIKKWQKNGDISEDDQANLEDDIQKATDKMMKKVDAAIEDKTKEIMKV
jgi:ribosome recycling factor